MRDATCSDADDQDINCSDLYDENPWLKGDPNLREGTHTRASFVVGFGFSIHF